MISINYLKLNYITNKNEYYQKKSNKNKKFKIIGSNCNIYIIINNILFIEHIDTIKKKFC
jgi:hypothetical protein